ncbi:MAG: MFS transporter, partial [Oscillospiraceae bacterium]|nr:MFS transporter [Oscillospiraceae bacterium]
MDPKFKRLKYACYSSNVSMSVAGNLSPVLFLTFKEMYGVSYSLLGLLILVNFVTQLGIDLVFSFFSHRFNISKTVKTMPIITIVGLLIYALWPFVFPNSVYVGLLIGTVVFSVSAGLGEVLISPVIAAIPAKEPEHEMSKLHSIYAWGVVFVIILSTLFLLAFGSDNWQFLAFLFALVPLTSAILFAGADVPQMKTPEKASGAVKFLKSKTLWLCVIAIFLGGASELVMAQWSSGYLERALGIPKVWGDIFGVALFAAMLGLGRTLYSKIGKNIYRVLTLGALGAAVCYVTAAVTNVAIIGLLACAFTGFCVSMLWPGSLVVASDRFQSGGVFIFAMMAAGGDLGASVVPQLVGIVTDAASASPAMSKLAESLSLAPDQLGMKLGLLIGALFPLAAVFVLLRLNKT